MQTKTRTETNKSLKARYTDASSRLSATDQILNNLANELCDKNERVLKSIDTMKNCVNELKSIALEPNVLESDDYFDLLIESEKNDKLKGWEQRVEGLNILKQQNELTRQVMQSNFDPWAKYRNSYGHAIAMIEKKYQNSHNTRGNCVVM